VLRPRAQRAAYAGAAAAPRALVVAARLRPHVCRARARQAAAKELRCAQKRVTENRTRVRGEPPVNSAAAAAAAQRLRADDGAGRTGAAPAVRVCRAARCVRFHGGLGQACGTRLTMLCGQLAAAVATCP